MLKVECQHLQEMMLDVFNDVLLGQAPPEQWRETRLTVILKKGDAAEPSNYRPIAIVPVMYKVFSTMLTSRIRDQIMSRQSVDQAAYRKGYSTIDHLLSTTLLVERSAEWNLDIWMGFVDFEKAFDTVEHNSLWEVLRAQSVGRGYIELLQTLYANQVGIVKASCESKPFEVQRGVKQGDPISALLFIAVMEAIFGTLKKRWNDLNRKRQGKYYGLVIDLPDDPLTSLRFADDVVLIATSRADITKMIRDLSVEAAKYGLKVHAGKTVVLTNTSLKRPAQLTCGNMTVKVAPPNCKKTISRKDDLPRRLPWG